MEIYNYETENNGVNELSALSDSLSQKEAEAALKAIKETKLTNLSMAQANYYDWFDQIILPILKDFTELNTAILQIEKNDNICVIATIKSDGLDITEICKPVKWALAFADHIGINVLNDQVALTLIYEFKIT